MLQCNLTCYLLVYFNIIYNIYNTYTFLINANGAKSKSYNVRGTIYIIAIITRIHDTMQDIRSYIISLNAVVPIQ